MGRDQARQGFKKLGINPFGEKGASLVQQGLEQRGYRLDRDQVRQGLGYLGVRLDAGQGGQGLDQLACRIYGEGLPEQTWISIARDCLG